MKLTDLSSINQTWHEISANDTAKPLACKFTCYFLNLLVVISKSTCMFVFSYGELTTNQFIYGEHSSIALNLWLRALTLTLLRPS
jgi:hypothetical protein